MINHIHTIQLFFQVKYFENQQHYKIKQSYVQTRVISKLTTMWNTLTYKSPNY